jgi:hypothetical protein
MKLLNKTVSLLLILFGGASGIQADYFRGSNLKPYRATGAYPYWSTTWTALDPKLQFDANGIPYVNYQGTAAYNPVTVAEFSLLAYNRFIKSSRSEDRNAFLVRSRWLLEHQDTDSGCWFYNFDFNYAAMGETLSKPWISGMAQGLGISVLTRAYYLTGDDHYLNAATRALLPFQKQVEQGGIVRPFTLGPPDSGNAELPFYEEYPTQPIPSYTLNGFMFSLVGLYDLAQTGNQDAASLFGKGMGTLRVALPLFDLGNGSAYDLSHLVRAPRPVHRDTSYHLVHIVLLNALSTATNDPWLLWYRNHWNSYGTVVDPLAIWSLRLAIWMVRRHPALTGLAALLFLIGLFLTVRLVRLSFRERGLKEITPAANRSISMIRSSA